MIEQYRARVLHIESDYSKYEDRIIAHFEHHMRPIISEMANILETYCVKLDGLTEIIAEVKKVFDFEFCVNGRIGSLLIRPDELRICLENLLENAQKATQKLIEPSINVTVSGDDRCVTISVQDNGKVFCNMDIWKLMEKGEGFKDINNIIEGWDGEIRIAHSDNSNKKPPVNLILKRL